MKKFPKKPIPIDRVLKPLKKVIDQLYTLTRTKAKSATYDGYAYNQLAVTAFAPQPDHDLSAECLEYHAERDREPIDIVMEIAYRLGFCQGYANCEENSHIDYLKKRTEDDRKTITELLIEIRELKKK